MEQIKSFLTQNCIGRDRAIKADILAIRFGLSLREINEIVRTLRKQGVLIGSSKIKPFGYYIPANEEESKSYLNTFKSELFDMLETFNAQKRARNNFMLSIQYKLSSTGQNELF
jgi:biotin operon repressor